MISGLLERTTAVVGRMTMYRLVLWSLGGLAALSLIFSVIGWIAYTPAAMAICWLTPLVTSYATNRLMAGIHGVVPHSESSLITAYLIFFIFPPSTDLVAVLAIALAALFASASKYLLAVRGRHIFNPAAAGAFLVTLCGVYFSGWWVGTTVLVPFAFVAAVAILHRTRRLPMAAVFLTVAGGIMVVRSLSAGIPVGTALLWPITSSPMVFFAGFMLSEPLTQPPRRWQQLLMAGVVGALFSIPLHVGAIYVAPESALLVGNLMAFFFGQRKGIELTLRARRQLTPSTIEFSFHPARDVSFRAGQYLEITLPHKGSDDRGLRRVFSISSAPSEGGAVAIGTKIPQDASTFKRALDALTVGSTVGVTTVAGDFLLPADPRVPLLLVAGGIGITPFASQLAERGTADGSDVVVLYSVAGADEIGYRDVLEYSSARVVIVSPEPIADLPAGWENISARRIDGSLLAAAIPDIAERQVLVSGPPGMVEGVGGAARKLHAAGVRTDYFSGY